MTYVSTPRYEATRAAWAQATQAHVEALLDIIPKVLVRHYPNARRLAAYGEVNDEGAWVLRCQYVEADRGHTLGCCEQADDRWEEFCDEIECHLDHLIDLTGDDYYGEQFFDAPDPHEVDAVLAAPGSTFGMTPDAVVIRVEDGEGGRTHVAFPASRWAANLLRGAAEAMAVDDPLSRELVAEIASAPVLHLGGGR